MEGEKEERERERGESMNFSFVHDVSSPGELVCSLLDTKIT